MRGQKLILTIGRRRGARFAGADQISAARANRIRPPARPINAIGRRPAGRAPLLTSDRDQRVGSLN